MTGYMNPDPLQCWDVIYHIFVGYINCYITKFGYTELFNAYITGSDPLLGSLYQFFWLYGNKWLRNQVC